MKQNGSKSEEKTDLEQTQKQVEELKHQLEELTNQYKRALADYQNLEKRTLEERREWAKMASKEIILKLLPSLDILLKASEHTKDQGVALSLRQFQDVLQSEGLVPIETLDQQFDPHLMECIDVMEGEEENKVVEELRRGYLLHGIVVRPAHVRVMKKKVDHGAEESTKVKED